MDYKTLESIARVVGQYAPEDVVKNLTEISDKVYDLVDEANGFLHAVHENAEKQESPVWSKVTDNAKQAEPAPSQTGGSLNEVLGSIYDYLRTNNLTKNMTWSHLPKEEVLKNYKYALTHGFLRHLDNDVIGKQG